MTKLSPAQVAILKRMAEGGMLEYVGEPIDRFAWEGGGMPRLNRRSVHVLQDLGLIKVKNDHWWGELYIITPAGQAYLEGLE